MKKLDMKKFKEMSPCKEGYEFVLSLKTSDLKTIFNALIDHKIDWANWLVARLLTRKDQLRYSLFAVESCRENFEKKYPESTVISDVITAVTAVIKNYTEKNRAAAESTARSAAAWSAAYAARSAAWSADAAATAAWSAALLTQVEYGLTLLKIER